MPAQRSIDEKLDLFQLAGILEVSPSALLELVLPEDGGSGLAFEILHLPQLHRQFCPKATFMLFETKNVKRWINQHQRGLRRHWRFNRKDVHDKPKNPLPRPLVRMLNARTPEPCI